MRNIESSDKLLKMEKEHKPDVRYIYEWINDVELNGRDDRIRTNYFRFQIVRTDKEGNQKVTYRNSWITDRGIGKGWAVPLENRERML